MHFAHTVRRWVAVLLCLLLCAGCAPQPSDSTPKEDENMTPALESFIKTVPETVEPFVVPAFDIPPQADNVFSTDPCNTDLVLAPQNDGAQNSMADFIGATMMTPAYHLAQGMSILEEGGARVQQMGAKAFKFYLCRDVASNYYQIDDWGELDNSSPMTIAQHRYYRALFAQDIDTFVIGVFTCAPAEELGGKNPAAYFAYQFTEENRQREYKELYELTYYLCKTYAGTGKTFIFQNWETDWCAVGATGGEYAATTEPDQEILDRITLWCNTRQDAVMAARRDAGCEGVQVYHALEVNHVHNEDLSFRCLVNTVVPRTYCDFYSFSAYGSTYEDDTLRAALDYLQAAIAGNRTGGRSGLFFGEYGYPESANADHKLQKIVERVLRICREYRVSHVFFYEMYDVDLESYRYYLINRDGLYHDAYNQLYKAIRGYDSPEYLACRDKYGPFTPDSLPVSMTVLEDKIVRQAGLCYRYLPTLGTNRIAVYKGRPCIISVTEVGKQSSPICFDADETLIPPDMRELQISVTLYDGTPDETLYLYYNSTGSIVQYRPVQLKGNGEWTTVTFSLYDCAFTTAYQGAADFFLCTKGGSPLYVSEVSVTSPS
ncbi:MAG: hypothetical protein IKI50_02960 [Clostridia bacterium]|nr:hypothetical protein [Clostridia bacterium]